MSRPAVHSEGVEIGEVKETSQYSYVKIETNSKGFSQVKLAVVSGETEAEMERVAALALKTYDDMQNALGRRAQFS